MIGRRLRLGVLCASLLAPWTVSTVSGAGSEQVILSADVYDGTGSPDGWAAGALWLGTSANQDAIRLGAAIVSLQEARWGYVSGGRTFRAGSRQTWDASARLGKATLEAQAGDFSELGMTYGVTAIPGRLTLALGDTWLDIGDQEGHLMQGGFDVVASTRWSGGLKAYRGVAGDLDDRFLAGRVTISASSATWTIGAAVGRTVPFRGAPGSVTQSSTEIYLSVALPLGARRMNLAASRFEGDTSTRRTLSMAWILPRASRSATGREVGP